MATSYGESTFDTKHFGISSGIRHSTGRISLDEIPNAPPLPGAPQLPQYQNLNYGKRTYHEAGVGEPINMAGRADALQQEELPKGFEQGLARAAAAAGTGQEAMGKAIEKGSWNLGKALGSVSEVAGRLAEESLRSKDQVDAIRYQELEKSAPLAFESEMIERKIPESEWPEYWRKDGAAKFMGAAGMLGVRRETRDILGAQAAGFAGKQYEVLRNNVARKSLESDKDLLNVTIAQGMAAGDFAGIGSAFDANAKAYGLGYINKAHFEDTNVKIAKARDQHYLNEAIEVNPAYVKEEAGKVKRGDRSQLFDFLNDDKAMTNAAYQDAVNEVNRRQQDAVDSLSQRMLDGEKLLPADIDKAADQAGLDVKQRKVLHKQAENFPIAYNEKAIAAATSAVIEYDGLNDLNAKGELVMTRYDEIRNQIITTVPREYQKDLLKDLSDSRKSALKGDLKSPQQAEMQFTVSELNKLADQGLLRDPGTKAKIPSGREKGEIVDEEEARINDQRHLQILREVKDFSAQHPGFGPQELYDFMRQRVSGFVEENADAAAKYAPDATVVKRAEINRPQYLLVPGGHVIPPATAPTGPRKPTEQEYQEKKAGKDPVSPTSRLKSSVPFERANVGQDRYEVAVTNYVPGMGGTEGRNEVKGRQGPAYTMEDYVEGKAPYVSVAMDEESPLQGKFLTSADPDYRGVVFKVEDTGSAFKGKGESRIDVAWRDKEMASKGNKPGATFVVTDEATAKEIAANRAKEESGTAGISIREAIDPNTAAMRRPRSIANISRIVIHGDVSTDVDNLIAYSKKVDRGYHYYIGRDGDITKAVPVDHIANHIKGGNSDSIGIVIAGADNGKMPTPAQERAAARLISALGKQYGINPRNVAGHGELQPSRRDVREGGNIAREIRQRGYI